MPNFPCPGRPCVVPLAAPGTFTYYHYNTLVKRLAQLEERIRELEMSRSANAASPKPSDSAERSANT